MASVNVLCEPLFLSELTAFRRDIHAHPELAFDENRTAEMVSRELERYGLEAVSYTHLDVYKRQDPDSDARGLKRSPRRHAKPPWGRARRHAKGPRPNGGHPFASGGASGPWKPTGPPPAKPSAQTRMEVGALDDLEPVSYTHLDVYKRQTLRTSTPRALSWSSFSLLVRSRTTTVRL